MWPTSRRRVASAFAAVALAVTANGLTTSASADDALRPSRFPGLPVQECIPETVELAACSEMPDLVNGTPSTSTTEFGWLNTAWNGGAGSAAALQWGRIPAGMFAYAVTFTFPPPFTDPTVAPAEILPSLLFASATMVSPAGSPEPYGYGPLITIRTVAFGAIPAEVTLQVAQKRNNGFPRPTQARILQWTYSDYAGGGTDRFFAVEIADTVDLYVRRVALDGVDVEIGSSCVAKDAALSVASNEIAIMTPADWDPSQHDNNTNIVPFVFDPSNGFAGLLGGTLNGTLDVPSFDGCAGATGDDVSAVLTAAISGPDNPVTIAIGAVGDIGIGDGCPSFDPETFLPFPTPPGGGDPAAAGCTEVVRPYPAEQNPAIKTVPDRFVFPGYAPGEGP